MAVWVQLGVNSAMSGNLSCGYARITLQGLNDCNELPSYIATTCWVASVAPQGCCAHASGLQTQTRNPRES